MHFLPEALENYITEHSGDEPQLLQELSRETHLTVLRPRMLTGHYQGRVLSLLSRILNPRYILEIGTYTGYSALCLAEGLRPDGELHTIDMNEELTEIQDKYFGKSTYAGQLIRHVGNALDIIPGLHQTFDLVFIDAEKTEYPEYLEAVLPKTRTGSLILSDNVLWSGKVTDPEADSDKATSILMEYNRQLKADPRLETVVLPIRDGLAVSRVR